MLLYSVKHFGNEDHMFMFHGWGRKGWITKCLTISLGTEIRAEPEREGHESWVTLGHWVVQLWVKAMVSLETSPVYQSLPSLPVVAKKLTHFLSRSRYHPNHIGPCQSKLGEFSARCSDPVGLKTTFLMLQDLKPNGKPLILAVGCCCPQTWGGQTSILPRIYSSCSNVSPFLVLNFQVLLVPFPQDDVACLLQDLQRQQPLSALPQRHHQRPPRGNTAVLPPR